MRGLSRGEMAESLGISRPTYVKLEKGEAKPTEQQKAILANLFDVSQNTFEKKRKRKNISADIKIKEVPKENVKIQRSFALYCK